MNSYALFVIELPHMKTITIVMISEYATPQQMFDLKKTVNAVRSIIKEQAFPTKAEPISVVNVVRP